MNNEFTCKNSDYVAESNPYLIRTAEEPASLFTVFNFRNQYHFLFKVTKGVPTLVLLDKVFTYDCSDKEPLTYIIEEEVMSAIKVPSYLFEKRRVLNEKIQQKESELKELEKRIEDLRKEVNKI